MTSTVPTIRTIAFAVTLCGLMSHARAQQRVGVVIHAWPSAPVSAEQVRGALPSAAAGSTLVGDPYGVAVARLRSGAVPAARLKAFQRARQLMAEGWRAYLGVEVRFADARLVAARASAEPLLDLAGGLELYAEISLRLGVVRHHVKRPNAAAVLFRLAALLHPSRPVTVAEFAPDVVAAFTKATTATNPQLSVRVAVSLPGSRIGLGAVIEVDGKALPAGQGSVQLAAGQHVFVARAAGYRSRGQVFEVTATTDRVQLRLDYDPASAAVYAGSKTLGIGTPESTAQVAMGGLVQYGELDAVMVIASVWRRGAPALLAQACAGLPARCGRVVELRYPKPDGVAAALRELWTATMASLRNPRYSLTLLVDTRLTEEHRGGRNGNGGKKPGTRRWYENPWVWIGASVAATAVGAAVLLSRDSALSPVFDVRPCDFGGCL